MEKKIMTQVEYDAEMKRLNDEMYNETHALREKLLNKANLTCNMREGWTCAVDNKAFDMDDYQLYAEHCTIASFDIPDMVAKMQENGYDVTEDMLTRFIELWLKQEGKNYLMERGVTLFTPCSCCNPFLLSVYHNGDLEFKDLYAV